MSRESAHKTLYSMVNDMTKANTTHPFNFDWEPRYDGDHTHGAKPNGKALITIDLKDETNVDDKGGIGSGEYFDVIIVEMMCTVAISTADAKTSEVPFLQDIEIDKAIDDIKARFSFPWKLAGDDVHNLMYKRAIMTKIQDSDKFTSKRLTCFFEMKYRSNRTQMD